MLELKCKDQKSDFWIVARAVSQFVRDCGKLPLAGNLPDMTANTDSYVKLQEIYGSRSDGDCAAIIAHVASIQKELGVTRTICQTLSSASAKTHNTAKYLATGASKMKP